MSLSNAETVLSVRPTKKEAMYFRAHEKRIEVNMIEAAKSKNFDDLEDLLYDYGRYLERNPEALSIL